MNVRIARHLDPVQPYPKNGNVGQRKPRCLFEVLVDGRPVSGYMLRLQAALEIAREYDPTVTKACVFDPRPIPKRV